MSRVHRRGVIAGPKGGGTTKTYAEFQAHIATLATGGSLLWNNLTATAGSYRITSPTVAEAPNLGVGLAGTTWGPASANGYSRSNSWVFAAAAHGFPSSGVKDAQMAGALEIFITIITVAGTGNVDAVSRNGVTSAALTGRSDRQTMSVILYWDGTQAQQMNPSTGTGPTPYTW
jgi:hypothetical protein